jgi:hypothetical protein
MQKISCEVRCYPATNTLTPDNSDELVPEPILSQEQERSRQARGASVRMRMQHGAWVLGMDGEAEAWGPGCWDGHNGQ